MSTYHSKNGRFSIDLEDADQRTMFQQVARFQEVFEEDTCGKCKSQSVRKMHHLTRSHFGSSVDSRTQIPVSILYSRLSL